MNVNSLLPHDAQANQNQVSLQLEKKWEKTGLLEGLNNEVERKGMAVLLENQAKQLVTEASSTGTDSNSEEMAPKEEPVAEEGRGDDMEEDLELEAIIKELEEELDSSEIGTGDNKGEMADDHTEDPGEGDLTEEKEDMEEGEKDKMDEEKEDMDEEEEVSLDEIISALREEEDKMDETEDKMEEGEKDKMDELEEAYNVIRFMKSKLNEVNLLNAKLLFSNKLFRNHSLNESQKMKVIENFDRAQSLREVKLVFATLTESFNLGGKTKRTIVLH